MKSVAEIRAERLRSQLDDFNAPVDEGDDGHCCGKCADESKKQGKKVCCADTKPTEESSFAQRVTAALTDPLDEDVPCGPLGAVHADAFVARCVASITTKNPSMPEGKALGICQVGKREG
jgi:hypothetical protein